MRVCVWVDVCACTCGCGCRYVWVGVHVCVGASWLMHTFDEISYFGRVLAMVIQAAYPCLCPLDSEGDSQICEREVGTCTSVCCVCGRCIHSGTSLPFIVRQCCVWHICVCLGQAILACCVLV